MLIFSTKIKQKGKKKAYKSKLFVLYTVHVKDGQMGLYLVKYFTIDTLGSLITFKESKRGVKFALYHY